MFSCSCFQSSNSNKILPQTLSDAVQIAIPANFLNLRVDTSFASDFTDIRSIADISVVREPRPGANDIQRSRRLSSIQSIEMKYARKKSSRELFIYDIRSELNICALGFEILSTDPKFTANHPIDFKKIDVESQNIFNELGNVPEKDKAYDLALIMKSLRDWLKKTDQFKSLENLDDEEREIVNGIIESCTHLNKITENYQTLLS